MPEKSKTGLDTTVVLRLLVGEPVHQYRKAVLFVERQAEAGLELYVSDLVIAESYFALHFHYEIPKRDVLQKLHEFLSSGIVQPLPGSVCRKVLQDVQNHKAGFADQMIHEQYLLSSHQVATFDRAMSKLAHTLHLD